MKKCFIVATLTILVQLIHAQKTDSLAKKLDSLHKVQDSSGKHPPVVTRESYYNEKTRITPKAYFVLLGTDLVQEVSGPFHSSAKTWNKVAAFAVLEGGLFLLDRSVQQKATSMMERNPNFKGVSHYVTNFGGLYEGYTLAAFGLYGWIFKNEKVKTTTLLATQAYITGAAMESFLKFLSGRQRPNLNTDKYPGPRPAFHGPGYSFGQSSSFPSGHTTVAFAAATVFAQEYRDRPIVPVIAYGAATLIGLSRITENAHWASDVFAGAALGYVTGLQVVRNYHRYAYLQNHKSSPIKNISFGFQYNFDHIEPGLVLTLK